MDDTHVSVDGIFALLSHNRRRLTLQYLKQNHNPIALDDLASQVTRWEQPPGTDPAELEVDQIRTALEKTHLPKFIDAGFIEYHSDDHTITCNDDVIKGAMENGINVIEFLFDVPDADELT